MKKKSLLSSSLLVTLLLLFSATLGAQDFPNKPIRLLVPFTPGGGTDFISRIVATALTETLKWPVVIDNRPGAAGNLAVAQAAQAAAAPDVRFLLPSLPFDSS